MPIKSRIRTVPHYPKQGIQFRDITTLLKDPIGLRVTIEHQHRQLFAVAGQPREVRKADWRRAPSDFVKKLAHRSDVFRRCRGSRFLECFAGLGHQRQHLVAKLLDQPRLVHR